MSRFDESNDALESRDWSGAVAENRRRGVTMVHSIRMSHELTEQLFAEAQRRGITPSELIREYVQGGLNRASSIDDTTVTVNLAELHRAIDTVVRRAA